MALRSSLRRTAYIFAVVTGHVLAHAACASAGRWPRFGRLLPAGCLSGPERLRAMIEGIGGTFVKFGQMLALQPDILPLEYCNALFSLLDRVRPFPFADVERTFVEEFGRRPQELFDSLETEPIATASIGQVHVAHLGGRKLAVKVQRPNAAADFAGDVRLMTVMIRLVKRLRLKMFYWIIEPTSEFMDWTDEELDYRLEARYMELHRRNALNNPRERVPAVLWDYVSRRTLVVEFVEGVNVLDYLRALDAGDEVTIEKLRQSGFDPVVFVRNILDNFLGDAYQHGTFHADLHPANLHILPGNVVGYIDFGITGVLSRYSRQSVIALTMALGRGDLDALCATFFKISTVDADSDVAGFREGIRRLAEGWYEARGKERRLKRSATLVMLDMLRLSRQTGIYPERDVVKYIRSAIAIDGLITRVAPAFNLGRHLEIICEHYLKWHARRAVFTYNTLFGLFSAGEHLARDGTLRAGSFIHKLVRGEMSARAELERRGGEGDGGALDYGVLRVAAAAFFVSLLVAVTGGRAQLGVNLFTAEIVFAAFAAATLLTTGRRPAEGR